MRLLIHSTLTSLLSAPAPEVSSTRSVPGAPVTVTLKEEQKPTHARSRERVGSTRGTLEDVQRNQRAGRRNLGAGEQGPARAPRSNGSVLSAPSPPLAASDTAIFSCLCSASPGVWAWPSAASPGGRGRTSQRHIQPEEGPPPPRVCLSGTERCLPGSPAVRRRQARPTQPQRLSKPDTDLSCSPVFPKAPPCCWDRLSLPSISSRLHRSAKSYQGLPRIFISTRHSPARGPAVMLCYPLHPSATPPSSPQDL